MRKYTHLLPCPEPSICKFLPEADKPLSSDNAAKDACAHAAATLGPIAEAKNATYKNFPLVSCKNSRNHTTKSVHLHQEILTISL